MIPFVAMHALKILDKLSQRSQVVEHTLSRSQRNTIETKLKNISFKNK